MTNSAIGDDLDGRLVSSAQVAKRLGISLRNLQRMVKDGEFVQPVRISANRIGFREYDVRLWILSRPRVTSTSPKNDAGGVQ